MNGGRCLKRAPSLLIISLMVIYSLIGLTYTRGDSTVRGHILMDFHHGEWDGSSTDGMPLPGSIQDLLREEGYSVTENYGQSLDGALAFQKYDALLIVSPMAPKFEESELTAITNYVQNGGGFLETVDTQMYYHNDIPNQVAEKFGVSFIGDYGSVETIVNFDHPITIDKTQGDLFNPFLLSDAAIGTYPKDAVVLVDVVEREATSNSTTSFGTLFSMDSSKPIYPAMIALRFGMGRAVFGPANGLTQPWGTVHYNRNEPNKMLLNTIEWLVGEEMPSEIIAAEEELYQTAKGALQEIIDNVGYMSADIVKDLRTNLFSLALSHMININSELDPEAYPELDAMAIAGQSCLRELAKAMGQPDLDVHDIMKRNLPTDDGVSLLEAIENKHKVFRGTRVVIRQSDILATIESEINSINYLIQTEEFPKYIEGVRSRFNQLEAVEQQGKDLSWSMFQAGQVLAFTALITEGASAPVAIMVLKARTAITYLNLGLDLGEQICLALIYEDVCNELLKIYNIYTRDLQRVIKEIETGSVQTGSVKLEEITLAENVLINSISSFGGTIVNDGSIDVDARLAVEITDPQGMMMGPFYGPIEKIKAGESVIASIDIPFLGYEVSDIRAGPYKAVFYVKYGLLDLEKTTPSIERSFTVGNPVYDFQKSVGLTAVSSTDVTVRISVRNRSDSEEHFTVIDTIPKELTPSANDIVFLTPNYEISETETDIVVTWSLILPAGASAEVAYRVHTPLDSVEVEWLPLPAAVLQSTDALDLSSLIYVGEAEVITQHVDALLVQLNDRINALSEDVFNGGGQAKLELLGRIEGVQAAIREGDLGGALTLLLGLFVPDTGGESSIEYWITDEGARSPILSNFDNAASLMSLIALAHKDEFPPTTDIALSGTPGADGWYVSKVTVTLSAADEGGSGVAETEYSLNGGPMITYLGPFTVDEGITMILYRSVDNAGNVEGAKQQEVKVDKTPPEARIWFDEAANGIIVGGTDNMDDDVQVFGDLVDSHAGTEPFVYELTDDAGNCMRIRFERTTLEADGEDRSSSVRVLEIRYDDGESIAPVSNSYKAKFVLDKKTGELKHLTCKICVGNVAITSKYNGQRDETTITLKDGGKKEEKVTLPGPVVVELVTHDGNLNYRY